MENQDQEKKTCKDANLQDQHESMKWHLISIKPSCNTGENGNNRLWFSLLRRRTSGLFATMEIVLRHLLFVYIHNKLIRENHG